MEIKKVAARCKRCEIIKELWNEEVCLDCAEWQLDALAPWNQESPENYYKEPE